MDCCICYRNRKKPEADPYLLRKEGVMFGKLGAEPEVKLLYKEMEKDDKFMNPISWDSIETTDYDGLILTGGHAKGMRQYLENIILQKKISSFWSLNRPVGAICHGTLLLARCKKLSSQSSSEDEEKEESCLHGRKTTCLPKYLENTGYYLTRWKLGDYYKTYNLTVEDEMRDLLNVKNKKNGEGDNDKTEICQAGWNLTAKGTLYNSDAAYVVQDGKYVSARWPGDAYLYGRNFVKLLYDEEAKISLLRVMRMRRMILRKFSRITKILIKLL